MTKDKKGKSRYSDKELQEFKDLIMQKLESARKELNYLQDQISNAGNGTSDTSVKFNGIEDGVDMMEKEYLTQMASRQIQFIKHLENALIRIENKTYGICRETGKLISKERLRAVPHATLSIEAKMKKK
jgi:RNA polymerase-binding transcription factor DksA